MRIYFIFLCISIQFLQTTSYAQAKIFNTVIENANFGSITSVQQDRQGYIWFSTGLGGNVAGTGGIHRYDGKELVNYTNDANDNNSLGNNWAECLYIDTANIIWVGTYGAGLDRFDPATNTFTHFRRDARNSSSLSSDTVQCILEDHFGNLWIGTPHGLNLMDRKTGKFTRYLSNIKDASTISSNAVRVIYEDHQKTLWIGCGNPFEDATQVEGGLNRFNRNTGKFTRYLHDDSNPNSIANNKVRAIFEDSKGNFWIGTAGANGLHSLDRATGIFSHYYYDAAHPDRLSRPFYDPGVTYDHITFITEDAIGGIWIGTAYEGVNRYDPVAKKMTHYGYTLKVDRKGNFNTIEDTLSGLSSNGIWDALASKDGLLWICTLAGSLMNVDITKTIIPYNKIKADGNTFYLEPKTNTLWIGTDQGLIKRDLAANIDKRWSADPNDPNSLTDNNIAAMRVDREGKFWMSTSNGLNKFDPVTNTFTVYWPSGKNDSAAANYMYNLLIDHNNDIWVSTGNGVYTMDHQTKQFTHSYIHDPKNNNSLIYNRVVCLAEAPADVIWMGTFRGISRLDEKTGKMQNYLIGSVVTNIFLDASGIIWAGATDGLFRYNNADNTFSRYIDANSKTEIIDVLHIMEDERKNLWVTTRNSIVKINQTRDTVKIYGESYGIHPNPFLFCDNLKAPNGELFFGDHGGYYSFSPGQLRDNSSVPQVNFTKFRLGDEEIKPVAGGILKEPVWSTKEIKLNYKQNVFSFEFSGLDYKNTRPPKYLFMLENYDDTWRPIGIDRRAFLFNIPPGKYIFHLRAVNADGLWGEKTISIIITPPWYSTWWFRVLSVIALIIVIYSIIKERSRKLKAENLLLEQKVNERTERLKISLDELKATQAQLIQSEKMASLGELTAGIAHEIQNPLNFVNNFSEVNNELIEELQNKNGHGDSELLSDIFHNNEKIIFHGKRADSIVKGMLQHSRTGSGQKELTDINVLADEYLRLAYHGFRAKDKTFNAKFETDFDSSVGKINIIPQDIGRVLLNLINNAFYAANERHKTDGIGFEPCVGLTTQKLNGKIEIRVNDNGNGISQKNLDKIFQPFFTTKPTGQGTGLGLSLAYDIIKAHGGEIKVESKEGEGTWFTITLPS